MPKMTRLRLVTLLCLSIAVLHASNEAPSWLSEVASRNTPTYSPKVPAVVLVQDTRLTLEDNGRVITSTHKAIKVLTREGRDEAYGQQIYQTDTGRIRDAHAWMISPSSEVLKIGKENTYDLAYAINNSYEALRVRQLDGRRKADPGSVFGYEIISEETVPFSQFEWHFQDRMPVLLSRYTLTLPAGWHAEGIVYNHELISPFVQGSTYTWELRDMPYIEPEPSSPQLFSIVPRLVVNCLPRPEAKLSVVRAFTSWRDVSRWTTEISDPQAKPNGAITDKARALTAGAKTEFDRLQAIATYVQLVRYVSVQTGLGRGGGYRPRPASDTFLKEYGDCKDKSTLMRASLNVLGIQSYLVPIFSGDPSYVHEEWPSPQQFNHAIVAVRVSPEVKAASIIEHPALGRLLLFDATNRVTSFGDLPWFEQGSLALVAAGNDGVLVRTPVTPPKFNMLDREIFAVLNEDGGLSADVHEEARGQAASAYRSTYYGQPGPEFRKVIERWIAHGATGAVTSKIDPQDGLIEGRFVLNVVFRAPDYAQRRGNRMLAFKPAIVNRREGVFLLEPERKYPVMLNASASREVVRVRLPAAFKVDEKPDEVKLETPFGFYIASCEEQNGELVFTRSWEVRSATIPVAQYGAVREFYERILAVEQAPVVLVRR